MNFFAHAHLARESFENDPFAVLGSVAPDLASIARVRITAAGDERVAAGIRLHHRADAIFHRDPAFLAGISALRLDLKDAVSGRGVARAAAHVAWELALDSCVPWDGLSPLFLAALEQHGIVETTEASGWARVIEDAARRQPSDYADPAFVAARVCVALRRHVRLAGAVPDERQLARAVRCQMPAVVAASEGIFERLRSELPDPR